MSQSSEPMDDVPQRLTNVRLTISPYLSPPILNLIKTIDSNAQIQQIIPHNEPSMVMLTTILCLYLLKVLARITSQVIGNSDAIEGLDTDAPEDLVLSSNVVKKDSYTDSVVLFGPEHGGKSVLFHTLTNPTEGSTTIPDAVLSLKANMTIVTPEKVEESSKKASVRLVDYPGHITLSSQLPSLLHPSKSKTVVTRAILVLDATKPVSSAASLLYTLILTNAPLMKSWEDSEKVLLILVACHKADAPNAKNWRRIKIQLRSELDKLKKIAHEVSNASGGDSLGRETDKKLELVGKAIDLEDLNKNGLPMVKLSFVSTSCRNGEGMKEIKAFVEKGDIPQNTSALKSNKVR